MLSSKPNTYALTGASAPPDTQLSNVRRLSIFGAMAAIEMILATFLFDFDQALVNHSYWLTPLVYANALAKITVLAFALFTILAMPRRNEIVEAHNSAVANDRSLSYYIVGNLILFAALLLTKFAFSRAVDVSVSALWGYIFLLVSVGISLALVLAPLGFWRQLAKLTPIEIGIAYASGGVAVVAGYLGQEGWDSLSSATLNFSHWFLSLYESNVVLDDENRILGIGQFRVQVFHGCSGYEGVGLMIAFLSVYTWVFRRDLRFPNVLLLFPIGIAAVWTLNALRIAVLVTIGAHVSPDVAVQGFHSAAGWISFIFVTLSVIAVSRRVPFFANHPRLGVERVAVPGGAWDERGPAISGALYCADGDEHSGVGVHPARSMAVRGQGGGHSRGVVVVPGRLSSTSFRRVVEFGRHRPCGRRRLDRYRPRQGAERTSGRLAGFIAVMGPRHLAELARIWLRCARADSGGARLPRVSCARADLPQV